MIPNFELLKMNDPSVGPREISRVQVGANSMFDLEGTCSRRPKICFKASEEAKKRKSARVLCRRTP
jgi:hypothetical protein